MSAYYPFLAALVALLIGLTVGKAWERYKLRSGRLIDRRRVPESLHYIVGLNFLVTNQIDLAIEELSKAAENLGDALEIHLLLGSLYREKGQVARAINIHQSLLQRPRLTRLEQAHVLLCLGLDFKRGGFVDRALEAFNEVIKLDPKNQYALLNIEKLHEDQHQWQEAYEVRRSIGNQAGAEDGRSQAILAFLENELGLQAVARGDYAGATARFQSAIDLDPAVVPAYLNLGDIHAREERMAQATGIWEEVIGKAPERAYLTFDRLSLAYEKMGTPERFAQLLGKLIAANAQDWRARLRAGQARRSARRRRPCSGAALRSAGPQSSRPDAAPGHLAGARASRLRKLAGTALRRSHQTRGLLHGPPYLHAVPLSQHRVALAVSALPRMEHLCRRSDRAGKGT